MLALFKYGEERENEAHDEKDNCNITRSVVGLSDNVTYVVEDLGASEVSKYKYTLNFNPKMWIPVNVDVIE